MDAKEKEYNEKLQNGTEIKAKLSIKIENFNENDYQDVFSSFAGYSRDFYLNELKSVVDGAKPEYCVTSGVIAEVLSRLKPMTQRHKREIRENPDTLKHYLKENLGIEVDDI